MTRLAHEREHDADPPDFADAFVLLDEGEAQLAVAECCGKFICCCDEEAPERYRNYKPAVRRVAEDRT